MKEAKPGPAGDAAVVWGERYFLTRAIPGGE
jgi:hypothetical protein